MLANANNNKKKIYGNYIAQYSFFVVTHFIAHTSEENNIDYCVTMSRAGLYQAASERPVLTVLEA